MSLLPRRILHPLALALRNTSVRVLAVVVLGGSSVVLSGCPGELDPRLKGGTGPTVCDGAALMQTKCGMSGCHGVSAPAAGLDLYTTAGLAGRLLGQPGNATLNPVCASNTTPYLVTSSNPAMGFLLDKLMATPPCGTPMPQVPGPLPQTDIDCIEEWSTAVTTGQIQ